MERLKLLCARSASMLPQYDNVTQLYELSQDKATANQVSPILVRDPILLARLFRHAASVLGDKASDQPTSIPSLLQRLGQKELGNFSILMREGMTREVKERDFEPVMFARYSMFVGRFAGKLVGLMSQRQNATFWLYDEIYAAGLLHYLGYPILWAAAPDVAWKLSQDATVRSCSFGQVFEEEYGEPLGELSAFVAESWGIHPLFAATMRLHKIEANDLRRFVATASLLYSRTMANLSGYSFSNMVDRDSPSDQMLQNIGLLNEDAKSLLGDAAMFVEQIYPLRFKKSA